MSIAELRRVRLEKLAAWRARGVEPYAYHAEPTHHAADIQALSASVNETPSEHVRVAGRLMTIRGHGKTSFAHLLDGTGRVQIYARADHLGPEAYDAFQQLDVGDWVCAQGALFRTKTGEITVRADRVTLLAKSLRPLPEKWHGLRNPETRYRQRYADLFMNAEVRDVFRRRAGIVAAVRAELDRRGFLEVETPVLQPLYGGAFARPFVTHHNALDLDLYLRISNELYLKRLIVGGLERVYEIARDFRNEGMDRSHNPEFSMLECYQAFADYIDMMTLTEALVSGAAVAVHGTPRATYQGTALDFTPPWPRVAMVQAVSEAVGEDLADLDPARLRRAAARAQVPVEQRPGAGAAGAGQILDEMFSTLVQPRLIQPTLVVDYPAEISPLARVKRGDPRVVERFECVVAGMELANAFSEQNDPVAQARAFEDQMRRRAAGDAEAQVMDHDYVRALEYGMPPTGGLGIGLDRLVMLLLDARSIRDVLLFPQLRPEEGLEDEESEPATEGAEGR